MLSILYTEGENAFRDEVRSFVEREIAPHAERIEETTEYPRELLRTVPIADHSCQKVHKRGRVALEQRLEGRVAVDDEVLRVENDERHRVGLDQCAEVGALLASGPVDLAAVPIRCRQRVPLPVARQNLVPCSGSISPRMLTKHSSRLLR